MVFDGFFVLPASAALTDTHLGNHLDETTGTLNSISESPKAAIYTLTVDIPQILFQV
jgi:hypothetical protein